MKIGIFCSANDNIAPVYFSVTEELGQWMGNNGHTLVYGGCDSGLMKCIGHAVHDNGGQCIGVVPDKVEQGGCTASCLDVHIPVDNLSARKDLMLLHSDVMVALPGGIGTLDEVFSVAAGNTIGYHTKRVLLLNINGFWDKAIEMLDHLQKQGMIRGDYHQYIDSAQDLQELTAKLADIEI